MDHGSYSRKLEKPAPLTIHQLIANSNGDLTNAVPNEDGTFVVNCLACNANFPHATIRTVTDHLKLASHQEISATTSHPALTRKQTSICNTLLKKHNFLEFRDQGLGCTTCHHDFDYNSLFNNEDPSKAIASLITRHHTIAKHRRMEEESQGVNADQVKKLKYQRKVKVYFFF